MTDTPELPELEPLEEAAAPPAAPAAPAPMPGAGGLTPVSLPGLPAPAFGMRAQKQYYKFFFAGLVMFLGCLMPFGPEWEMAGYQTLGGSVFTIIALGIMWSSWVAISHGKFDLSNMRWLVLAFVPLTVMIWHLIFIFDEPAVQAYITEWTAAHEARKLAEPQFQHIDVTIRSWGDYFTALRNFRNPLDSNSADTFIRAYGTGKIILLIGSFWAVLQFFLGVGAGMKAGKAQKAAREAQRTADKQRKRR